MIEAARDFVPVADEVYRLQTGDDVECRAFQTMAGGGHYRGAGGTRQGIYVCAPSGALLASINSNSADAVLEMIERGRAAWEELPESERWLADAAAVRPAHRWEDDYPEDGLVLETFQRDLLEDGERPERWNRDHAWFSRAEARRFLPEQPAVGMTFSVPSELVRRLARYHLVDDVRGQTVPFADQEVEHAALEGSIDAVDGARVEITWTGSTRSDAAGEWLLGDNIFKPKQGDELPRGLAAELRGTAVFDLEAGRFEAFDLVAIGERWGRTRNNGRRRDAEAGQIGFVFSVAPRGGRRIPPAFVQIYDAAWLTQDS